MNIVFIVVDSLRSDHLGVNNYKRKTSPNIDKLAKEGIFFTTAIPTVARTTGYIAYPVSVASETTFETDIHLNIFGLKNDENLNTSETVWFSIYRDGADALDTYNGDIFLNSATIEYIQWCNGGFLIE